MRTPLRRQIMVPMAAIMLLTVVVLGGVGALLSVKATKARIAARIEGVAQILDRSNFPLTDAVLRQMRSLSGAEMAVVNREGELIAASSNASDLSALIAIKPRSDNTTFELADLQWLPHGGYFHTEVPLDKRLGNDHASKLHLFYPEADYRGAWLRALVPSLAFVMIALPATVGLAGVTASHISHRMGRLRDQVDRIAKGEFQQLKLDARDDEIRDLAQAVNRMSVMLARYEDDVRRTERMRTLAHLGSGIAHQLRNSATGCAIAMDLHASECPNAADCENLHVAKQQLHLMEEYIHRFLQLGKTKSSMVPAEVNLAVLIEQLLPLTKPAARHANVQIQWEPPATIYIVSGDAASLSQLLINVIINAIEAAGQAAVQRATAGLVEIALMHSTIDAVSIVVRDSGFGPPQDLRDNLFQPFVTAKTNGVGLGLAVAKDVARRHKGSVEWNRVNESTQFTIELPCHVRELERA